MSEQKKKKTKQVIRKKIKREIDKLMHLFKESFTLQPLLFCFRKKN